MTVAIPQKFSKYFWDCEFKKLSWHRYARFIIERILNFGNVESVKWLLRVAGQDRILQIVAKSRELDEKTKTFWKVVYGK